MSPDFVRLVHCWVPAEGPEPRGEALAAASAAAADPAALCCALCPVAGAVPVEHSVAALSSIPTAAASDGQGNLLPGASGSGKDRLGDKTEYELTPKNVAPRGSTVYNARVALMLGLGEGDKAAALKAAPEPGAEHLTRLLRFVVVRTERGGEKGGIFCLGGRCDPALDGDPER